MLCAKLFLECKQTPLGVLCKLHMVPFHSALKRCLLFSFLVNWGATQILQLPLGNESPAPEEHKMAVGSAIEALVGI